MTFCVSWVKIDTLKRSVDPKLIFGNSNQHLVNNAKAKFKGNLMQAVQWVLWGTVQRVQEGNFEAMWFKFQNHQGKVRIVFLTIYMVPRYVDELIRTDTNCIISKISFLPQSIKNAIWRLIRLHSLSVCCQGDMLL